MSDFLDTMTSASRGRAEQLNRQRLQVLEDRIHELPRPVPVEPQDGFGVFAEAKLRSPASGRLVAKGDDTRAVVSLARAYEAAGAAAISVLTEPTAFDGTLEHLTAVSEEVSVPVIRKDFLIDPNQLVESRAHGASGVLLIARVLGAELLTQMIEKARELGLFTLVELFGPEDLASARAVTESIDFLGVNTRNLSDLSVDTNRLATMATLLPADVPWVAESGLVDGDDAAAVAELGYQIALVGSGLVTANDPDSVLREFIHAGRNATGKPS